MSTKIISALYAAHARGDFDRDELRTRAYLAKAQAYDAILPRRATDYQDGRLRLSASRVEALAYGGFQAVIDAEYDGRQLALSNPFQVGNAPLLVPDAGGPVDLGDRGRFREDPAAAIRIALLQAVATANGKEGWGTTHVFYATAGDIDGAVRSTDSVYATALVGGGSLALIGTALFVGQALFAGTYYVYQAAARYDTSSITDSDVIESAVPALYLDADASATNFTLQARGYDWGTLTTADLRTPAQLAALTLLGTLASTTISGAGYYNLTPDAALLAAIDKSGDTDLWFCSNRTVAETAPTGNEYLQFEDADNAGTTQDPKLTVVTSSVGTRRQRQMKALIKSRRRRR